MRRTEATRTRRLASRASVRSSSVSGRRQPSRRCVASSSWTSRRSACCASGFNCHLVRAAARLRWRTASARDHGGWWVAVHHLRSLVCFPWGMNKPVRVRRLNDVKRRSRLQQIVRRGGKSDRSIVKWRRAMVVLVSGVAATDVGGGSRGRGRLVANAHRWPGARIGEWTDSTTSIGMHSLDPQWAGGRHRQITTTDRALIVHHWRSHDAFSQAGSSSSTHWSIRSSWPTIGRLATVARSTCRCRERLAADPCIGSRGCTCELHRNVDIGYTAGPRFDAENGGDADSSPGVSSLGPLVIRVRAPAAPSRRCVASSSWTSRRSACCASGFNRHWVRAAARLRWRA